MPSCTSHYMALYALTMDVAISELRANLKSYVDRARAGERVVVTERGVPVARLGPAEEESLLDRLEREGVVTRATEPKRGARTYGRPAKAKGSVSELLLEMRDEGDARVLG